MEQALIEFQQLIKLMMSPENEVRSEAEKKYEEIPEEQKSSLLFACAKETGVDPEVRSLCLVLLRRLLANSWDNIWNQWPSEQQESFKAHLIVMAPTESDANICKRISDVIGEVARRHVDEESGVQNWQEVLLLFANLSNSNVSRHKEMAMNILENVPGLFGLAQSQNLATIKHAIDNSLRDADASVRSIAARAVTAFICENDEDTNLMRAFSDVIPKLIKISETAIELDDEDDIPLQCLTDLASTASKILKPHLRSICQMCLKTVENKDVSETFRHSALEIVVTLCESSPATMRKQGAQFINMIIGQCLSMMTEHEEDDLDWHTKDDAFEDDEDDSTATTGESSLDRVACALGAKTTFSPAMQIIQGMLQSEDWRFRYAGLMGISTIAEGTRKKMEEVLEQVVDITITFLSDKHPRVRYASCNALGQMCVDFSENKTIQKKCHSKVVPALLQTLEDLANPRVAAHAGAALVNFCEVCPKNIIAIYLFQIMTKLEFVLEQTFRSFSNTGKKLVLEQIITTIASVADSAQEQFVAYYDKMMPCLKHILENANNEELRLLRGKTIECISLVGLAVGKERFIVDAHEIMDHLLRTQTGIEVMEDDDPQVSYMIAAWARICKLMGEDFAQYMPVVMPTVLKAASHKPEVTVVENEEKEDTEDENWQYVDLGDAALGIRTAGLEDKATACEMLVCYARELGHSFAPYVSQILETMIPLLKFYFHDGVRSSASEIFPHLLKDAEPNGPEFVQQSWALIFDNLLMAVEKEPDLPVRADHLDSLAKCVEVLGVGCLSPENLDRVMEMVLEEFKRFFKEADERQKQRQEDEYDEEEENNLKSKHEEDSILLARISDVIHALFGTYKSAFIPYFEKIIPNLTTLISPNRPSEDRQWSLCMWDDAIEFAGEASIAFQELFLPRFVASLSDEAGEVRQAAAYGIGMMAMNGGNVYAQACAQSLPALVQMIQNPNCRATIEDSSATDNAISSVGKILKYNSSMVENQPQIIAAFMSWLPTHEDEEEAAHIYGYFCDLVENNNPAAIGLEHANLPRILEIIADAFRLNCFDESNESQTVIQRMKQIVMQIRANNEIFAPCYERLNDEQKQAIEKAFS